MFSKRLPLVLTISILCAMCSAHASSIGPHRSPSSGGSYWNTWIAGGMCNTPSSSDNWLGGTGNWSNGAGWSAGLPGSSSDVFINTGNDNVTLDVSSSINSLTLGGASGSSILSSDGQGHALVIAGALTVNQSGTLSLFAGDTLSAGASSSNMGAIDLEYSSSLHVSGNLNNSAGLSLGESNASFSNVLSATGTLTNSGAIMIGFSSFISSGSGTATLGGLANTGSINLGGGSTMQVSGDVTNSGTISAASPSNFSVTGNFINSGTFVAGTPNQNCCASVVVAGALTNAATGSFELTGAISTAQVASLINQGSIIIDDGGYGAGTMLTVDGSATNSGTITLSTLAGEVGLTVKGTLANSAGAQLNMAGGSENASIGTLINYGLVSLDRYDNMSVGSALNGGTIYLQDRSSLQVNGNLTNSGEIQFNYLAVLAVSGNVTNSGEITTTGLNNSGNTINIVGTVTNQAAGTLSLNRPGDVANVAYVTNAGTISIADGATMNVTGGTHAAMKALPGFLNTGIANIAQGSTLASPLTYSQTSGQTTVDGTLRISGLGAINFAGGAVYGNGGTIQGSSIISNAAINIGDSPMAIGQLFMVGNYTQGANGGLTFDIAGAAPGQYDQLNVSGKAQLNGLMTVDLLNGFVPQIGNTFDIMNFASGSGAFSKVLGLPINNQEHFVLEYNSTNLTLDVVQGPETNVGDGGLSIGASSITWAGNSGVYFGASNNGASDPTPEPSSILLVSSGLLGMATVLRRKGRI